MLPSILRPLFLKKRLRSSRLWSTTFKIRLKRGTMAPYDVNVPTRITKIQKPNLMGSLLFAQSFDLLVPANISFWRGCDARLVGREERWITPLTLLCLPRMQAPSGSWRGLARIACENHKRAYLRAQKTMSTCFCFVCFVCFVLLCVRYHLKMDADVLTRKALIIGFHTITKIGQFDAVGIFLWKTMLGSNVTPMRHGCVYQIPIPS